MMDELNALNAPKKVVDGLVEVFDGLAQMFAGVSEQLDMLAANAKTEDEPEFPVAEQPVLPVMICPLSSRQVKYLKVSDKNTYISFWSVGIFMHTISLYIF